MHRAKTLAPGIGPMAIAGVRAFAASSASAASVAEGIAEHAPVATAFAIDGVLAYGVQEEAPCSDQWKISLINRPVGESSDKNKLEALESATSKQPPSGCLDRVLLVGAAFWIADAYLLSPMWVFLLWNSMFIVHLSFKDFRTHLRSPLLLYSSSLRGLFTALWW
jgi:hypothetical protein